MEEIMLLSGAKKSPGGSFTEQGSPQAEGESEVFILNQSMNYPPDREAPSKTTTYSPWKETPKPGSQDKLPAHE